MAKINSEYAMFVTGPRETVVISPEHLRPCTAACGSFCARGGQRQLVHDIRLPLSKFCRYALPRYRTVRLFKHTCCFAFWRYIRRLRPPNFFANSSMHEMSVNIGRGGEKLLIAPTSCRGRIRASGARDSSQGACRPQPLCGGICPVCPRFRGMLAR
jgi:hypothetical protein